MKFDSDRRKLNEEMREARKRLQAFAVAESVAMYDRTGSNAQADRDYMRGARYLILVNMMRDVMVDVTDIVIKPVINEPAPAIINESALAVFYANVNTLADNAVFSAFGIKWSKNIPSLEAWLSGNTLTNDTYPYLKEISDKDKLTILWDLAYNHDTKFERIRNTFVDDVQKPAGVLLKANHLIYEPEYGYFIQTALVYFLKKVEHNFSRFVSSKNALLKNYKETDKNYVQEMKTLLLHTIIKLVSGFQTGFTTAYTEFKKDTDNFSPNSLVNADFILAHNTYINSITSGKNLILTQIDDILTGMKAIYSVYDPTEIAAILTDASAKIKELFAVASNSSNFTKDATTIIGVLNKNYTDGMAYCSLVSSSCMSLLYEGEKKEGEKVKEEKKKEGEKKK